MATAGCIFPSKCATTAGVLLYDTNGIAAGGVTQLATLTTKPALQANDFVVI